MNNLNNLESLSRAAGISNTCENNWDKLSPFTKVFMIEIFTKWSDVVGIYTSVDLENWLDGDRLVMPVFPTMESSTKFFGSEEQFGYMRKFFEDANECQSYVWPTEINCSPEDSLEVWSDEMTVVFVRRSDMIGL